MKSFKWILVFLMMLGSQVSFALRGGDLVNNGGGIAEKNVLYAYESLEKYLKLCLASEACKINEGQRKLVGSILRDLPREKASLQLSFDSERKNPGTFMIEGLVRVARTGDSVGSPIIINSDLLYSKNADGLYEPVSISEAVAILVHELGHHHGYYTHEELDLLGVRISLLTQQKFISTPMIPWTSEIAANVFNADLQSSFPDVLLQVGDDVVDISREYKDEVYCEGLTIPIPILPIPDVELLTKKPLGSVLHNVHWEQLKEKGDVLSVTIAGNVSHYCAYKMDIGIRDNNYKVRISFKIRSRNGKAVFVPGSLSVNQFKDPWWKILRIPMNSLN